MTAKDERLLELRGSFDTVYSQMIKLSVVSCNPEKEEGCADEDEIHEYFTRTEINVMSTFGFIDFDKVLPAEITLEKAEKLLDTADHNASKGTQTFHYLGESRAMLFDDRVNFLGLTEPKEINYLTVTPGKELYPDAYPNATNFVFSLSKEVNVQRRVVYDVFMMFGDVGGLLDFILIIFRPMIFYISGSFMSASLVTRLFHRSESA